MIEKFDPQATSAQPVKFTDAALSHFENFLKKHDGHAIKIGVKTTGCSGLAYVIESINEMPQGYIEIQKNNLLFVIDPKALQYINGLEIDHVKSEIGLTQLVYNNPNAAALCGCGESFTITDDEATS